MDEIKERPLPLWRAWLVAYLIVVALLATCTEARGQTTPSCWPSQVGGSGTAAAVRTDAAGIAVAWGCTSDFSQSIAQFAGAWSAMLPNWQQIGAETVAGGPTAMSAAWSQYVQPWPRDDQGRSIVPADLYQIVSAALQATKALLPSPVLWRVAPNSTYATRPAYPFDGQVRSSTSNGRAPVGVECNCAARSVEGSSVYCALAGAPTNQVALCRKS